MPDSRRPGNYLKTIASIAWMALVAGGIDLIAVSVLWDVFADNSRGAFGEKQVTGAIFGVGMVALGVLLAPVSRVLRRRLSQLTAFGLAPWRFTSALMLTVSATYLAVLLPRGQSATWILFGYIVGACLLLPRSLGGAVLVLALALNGALAVINAIKTDLTGLPLTMLDVRIAAGNSVGLWDALNLPHWTRVAVTAGILMAGSAMSIFTVAVLGRALKRARTPPFGRWAAGRLSLLAGVVLLSVVHLDRVFTEVGRHGGSGTSLTTGVAELSSRMGALVFLAYSYHKETENTGDFFRSDIVGTPPTRDEIRAAVAKYVTFIAPADAPRYVLPNILVLMAESTFDPNRAFELNREVHSGLFAAGERTIALGPLYVNAIGGGSWVTEFEAIVGLDARLFGYSGYYTHASVSPFVTGTLATYLRAKEYRTWAFMPHKGSFYNYRDAYRRYGFDIVLDSEELGLDGSAGWRTTDIDLVKRFVGVMGPDPEAPFFATALLVENHGPHDCVRSSSVSSARFANTDDTDANCALAEYLRRLESTATAVALAEDYLRTLEQRTGRPFVLLIYGDHQPFSFTGTHLVKVDFGPMRKDPRKNITFFHLLSSVPDRVHCCTEMIPASLLPTLISAWTAEDANDLYVPVNLWLYERCGYDAVSMAAITWLTGYKADVRKPAAPGISERNAGCEAAYGRALTVYRESRLILPAAAP